MRKYCIVYIFLFSNLLVFSQQDPSFSHSMFNLMAVNPAYAGNTDQVCWAIVNRKDWLGFDYSPGVIAANINTPFTLFGRSHGVGLSFVNDRNIDLLNILKTNLSYAYKINTGSGKISLGFYLGFYTISFSNINFTTPDDPPQDDPLISAFIQNSTQNAFNRNAFDAGIGLFYKADNLFTGISSTNLLKPKYIAQFDSTSRVSRNLYLTAGYDIHLPNPIIVFKPSVLISIFGPFTKLETTALIEYNKKLWGGLAYRSGSAISALFGLKLISGLDLGIAYDIGTNKLGAGYGKGSYEIIVKGCFNIKVEKKTQRYKSVRFL